ncbi:GNAT family N-acetyltransferase [Secundilactobacillus folii]|uniref:GNAT family N-acetyltransferase n=1 Tax=Secundilactobacillus folii TaxID=2678357 RepID=A0A7X2XTP9_9LACO|nr:GNAT family N-acetyltransferase [Secundilactobacillus folii]MTV81502.1 GNAT family N-acetyltransferase [Secundilactobacillus folii]
MVAIKILPASIETDFDAVRQVYFQTWQATYRGQLPAAFLQKLTPETWQPERQFRNTQLALTPGGKIVGVCSYGPARWDRYSGYGEIYSIYILPAYQHLGIGQQLMQTALEILTQRYQQIYLEVLVTNRSAQNFYQQFGFQKTAVVRTEQVPGGELKTVVYQMGLTKS